MAELDVDQIRWTSADTDLMPDDGTRYEVVEGELFMTRAPDFRHQDVCGAIYFELTAWSRMSGLGQAILGPGVVFDEYSAVIPDVVWISSERLANSVDAAGHLTGAPELVVEVLSAGGENERRDREAKLKLYSLRGVQEYWIADWRLRQIETYRRERGQLRLQGTLFTNDELTSPLLAGFACLGARLFG
ncbi:MAG: Uma2 family endonuclease [Roseiflexaceae bacterium]|nr:Uma2 family endonuclease [Roseiflexaceae bacterium]